MAKRVVWKVGHVLNIKLRDNLYTIAQMLTSPALRFYDIHNSDGIWKDIDLNAVKPLFRVMVGNVVLHELVENKIKEKTVIPSNAPYEPYWMRAYDSMSRYYPGKLGDFLWLGGKIIDLGDGNISTVSAPTVKENLQLPKDRLLIEEYELTNMWGAHDLGDRLRRYFDTGINRDDLKFEVFPGLWNDREKLRPLTRRLPVPLR